jgi:hypothetical protein
MTTVVVDNEGTPIRQIDPESYDAMSRLFIRLGKRACPLYARVGGRGHEVIGTAVPVRGPKYAALLTASHVIDDLDDGHVVIAGNRTFLRFPAITVRFSHSRPRPAIDVDVAAIALPAVAAGDLSRYYEFTGASETGEFEDYSKFTLYGFVGCPHTKNLAPKRPSAERIVKPYFYVTREYAALPPEDGKRSAVHVALEAPLRRVNGPGGRIVSAPDPHGISGCGVWKVKLDPLTGRASTPQLVGIGIEHHGQPSIFVATRVGAGTVAIAELWKNLDEERPQTTTLELRED